MKRILAFFLILILAFSFVGCSSADSTEKSDAKTITIVDHNNNTVVLPADIQRIVVTDILPLPSVLAVFFGSAKKIVGISPVSMSAAENSILGELFPEILDAKTDFMEGNDVNVEELMKLKPDVVFYNASNTQEGQQLANAGFNAVAVSVNKWNYNCIETLQNWIALLSEMFPANDKAQLVQDYSNKIYDMVQERVAGIPEADRQHIFFLFNYSDTQITTSGKLFFGEWWAEAVGAVNAAQELSTDNSAVVNMEQIYTWNPDKIFITNFNPAQPQNLYGNTIGSYDWSGIKAVQDQQVYKMPLGIYRSYTPGADTPMTLLWLAKTVYPEKFADIDMTTEVRDYYSTLFGINLTDEQIDSIFNPSSAAATGATKK